MVKGIVKWFHSEKGFGFISTENGEDVFVHYSHVKDDIQILTEGEKVSLEIKESNRGRQSENVKRLNPSETIYNGSVIFTEDQMKIEKSVAMYPMGSYQMGEIARISGLMYKQGVDVVEQLKYLCEIYDVNQKG